MTDQLQAFLDAIRKFNPTLEEGIVRFRIPHSMIKALDTVPDVSCEKIKNARCNVKFHARVVLADGSEFWFGEEAIAYVHPVGTCEPCIWFPCKAYEGVVVFFKKYTARSSVTDPSINYTEITAWVGD